MSDSSYHESKDKGVILTLTLTPDNPSNTTITTPSGEILYTAKTLFPRGDDSSYAITQVCRGGRGQGQTLAALEWKDIRSDVVGLGEESVELNEEGEVIRLKKNKEMKLSKWMKGSIIQRTVSFHDENGRKYKWKGVGTGETMELYAHDHDSNPIAKFQPSRPRANPPKPAQLLLIPRAQEIIDTVVISFLFLEKRRRATDQSTQMKADVLGSPYISLPGGTQVVHKGGA